jgi:hypothetical protein
LTFSLLRKRGSEELTVFVPKKPWSAVPRGNSPVFETPPVDLVVPRSRKKKITSVMCLRTHPTMLCNFCCPTWDEPHHAATPPHLPCWIKLSPPPRPTTPSFSSPPLTCWALPLWNSSNTWPPSPPVSCI